MNDQGGDLLLDVYSSTDNPMLRATLAPVVTNPAGFARTFYGNLFARAPALRQLFPDDMAQQEMKLVHTLGIIAAGLEHPERIIGMLEELGARHRGYGVKTVHYSDVGEALIDALAAVNGDAFDRNARASWQRLYAWIGTHMRSG